MLKRWLLRLLIIFVLLVVGLVIAGWIANEARPEGAPGEAADALAHQIEAKVNKAAWDRTGAVWWNFADRNVHLWDKTRGLARVRSGDVEVLVDLHSKKGIASRAGKRVEGAEGDELVKNAIGYWENDSFWLNPLVKLFDEGTSRAVVKQEDGSEALLITYGSGGTTPGDAYLWILGEDGTPKAWKMWISLLPIGGLESSWDRWVELPGGARVSTLHEGLFTVEVKDVQAAPAVTAIEAEDPFAPLLAQPSSQPSEPLAEEPLE